MKIKLILFFISLLFVTISIHKDVSAQGQQEIIPGIIDYNILFQYMPEMRAVEQRLQNFRERKIQEIASKRQEFELQAAEFLQRSVVVSGDTLDADEARLMEVQDELNALQAGVDQELLQEQQRLMIPVLQQVQQAIDQVAEERGVHFVLKRTTLDGNRVLLYVSDEATEKYDITNDVLQALNI